MDLLTRLKKTGQIFKTKLVENGHKRGVLCLSCGKFAGGLMCPDCRNFQKCHMCGIVCRPKETYKTFNYGTISGNRKFSNEYYQDVIPFCKVLVNSLCEGCQDWRTRIKSVCFICGDGFLQSDKNYKENGNMCRECINMVNIHSRSVNKFGEPKNPSYQRFKNKTGMTLIV